MLLANQNSNFESQAISSREFISHKHPISVLPSCAFAHPIPSTKGAQTISLGRQVVGNHCKSKRKQVRSERALKTK
jgi:hypothetical protein